MADWVAALHGHGHLEDALLRLVRLCGAEAGLGIRQVHQAGRHRQFAHAEVEKSRVNDDALRGSIARDVLGDQLYGLRAGAVWTASEAWPDMDFETAERAHERMRALNTCDLAVVMLASYGGQVDYVELLFCHVFRRSDRFALEAMGIALAKAWSGRQAGTVERLISRRHFHAPSSLLGSEADILGSRNPAGLSRSEYRICAMISEGLAARTIADELCVSEATVRSHLRSIYSKTGAAGHVGLLHRLTTRPAQRGASKEATQLLPQPVNSGDPDPPRRKHRPY